MQDRWGDIQQASTEDQFVFAEAFARGDKDTLGSVPDGNPRRDARRELGTQVVAMETVV